jgi:hypothetical protein
VRPVGSRDRAIAHAMRWRAGFALDASHRPGLVEATRRQHAFDLARAGGLAPEPDRELRRRGNLRLDAAQATDHPGDGQPSDRMQQLSMHPPRERLAQGDPHGRAASLPWRAGSIAPGPPTMTTQSRTVSVPPGSSSRRPNWSDALAGRLPRRIPPRVVRVRLPLAEALAAVLNLAAGERLMDIRFVIRDRDSKFSGPLDEVSVPKA